MSESRITVFVVLDPKCGDNLDTMLPKGVPAWVVDSPASPSSSSEEVLLGALDAIDLHHSEHSSKDGYEALEIIGAKLSDEVRAALADLGLGQIEATPQGFRASRSA